MRDESFPAAPSDGSSGIRGAWLRRLTPEKLDGRVRSGALGVGGLVWTSRSKYLLPAWEDSHLVSSAWLASRRFWFGLSFVAMLFAGYDLYNLPQSDTPILGIPSTLLGRLLDAACSTTILIFCLWQGARSLAKSPSYLDDARAWQRFNAWCRINSGIWTELLVFGLIVVFASQFYGLRATEGNGIVARTLKVAVSFDQLVSGQWWRIFTAPLLHSTPVHLFINLMWLLFAARWMRGLASRPILPLILSLSAWLGACFLLLAPMGRPAVGLSAGLSGTVGFIVVTWLRTRSLPKFLGAGCLLWSVSGFLGEVIDGTDASSSAAGHAGGFLVGFCLGLMLVKPGAQLPITTNRFVDAIGNACGVILLALCALVSLNLSGVSWAQW